MPVNGFNESIFLINKPGKIVDRVYDGISKKIDGVGDGTKGTSKVATTYSRPDFVGKLKGEEVKLPNVKIEKVTFNKRTPNDTAQLRKHFNMIRKDLMKSMAYNPEKIKELKMLEFQIMILKI
ncbi:hypothetical protein JOC75_000784 [Metabacillus crassostreae]|uniref:hypothetical protein n=1 Tax=Metabacillus crassostreae TaxID=929098 RepID=UPI001EF7BB71|nr:hypothetical protein [Metabacillus crassostreae]MBM7602814.1 hypothetical protein [Metabacillus crassostreae]